ncbi:MAG: amidohydrolase, partial [Firmicutes bacterium]|nr:amidohydrolase [Bacillota bacterium]
MSADEQLYFGGEICTVDRDSPAAEALAVKEGKIVAVGSKEACRSLLSSTYEAVDLAGCALLPGFIDTHLHPTLMVFYDLNLNLEGVSTV